MKYTKSLSGCKVIAWIIRKFRNAEQLKLALYRAINRKNNLKDDYSGEKCESLCRQHKNFQKTDISRVLLLGSVPFKLFSMTGH